MLKWINTFRKDEDGAISVDWVVLTASAVALGLMITLSVQDSAVDGVDNMWASVP